MYRSLLATFLMGLVPATGMPPEGTVTLENFSIAPPAELVEIVGDLSASGVVILDIESGQQVYGRYADMRRPMASLTKLMTALLIVEGHDLDEVVTIPRGAEQTLGNVVYLPPGEQFTVGELLSATLISSANDAAKTLAIYHSGSIDAFVEEMNDRASALGLRATSFANPIGFDSPTQWSTPQDIAWLTLHAIKHPEIAERMARRGGKIISDRGTVIHLTHTHALLHADTAVSAGKTGTTNNAGQCLVSIVEEGGRAYLVVLFNSLERYEDMRVILGTLAPPEEPLAETTAFQPEPSETSQ